MVECAIFPVQGWTASRKLQFLCWTYVLICRVYDHCYKLQVPFIVIRIVLHFSFLCFISLLIIYIFVETTVNFVFSKVFSSFFFFLSGWWSSIYDQQFITYRGKLSLKMLWMLFSLVDYIYTSIVKAVNPSKEIKSGGGSWLVPNAAVEPASGKSIKS